MKLKALLFLSLIYQTIGLFAQSASKEIEILEAIAKYKGINSVCFQNGFIGSDSDTYVIIKSRSKNINRFSQMLSNLDPSMPNLSNYYSKITDIGHDSIWNKLVSDWSIALPKRNLKCQHKLSIGRPIHLSSNSDILVIITEYKHEAETDSFDALVYFYNVRRIKGNWIVKGTDHIYDIMHDWRSE